MRSPVATAFAIGIGLVVLLGYFFPIPAIRNVSDMLLGWAVILGAAATLIGILNLLGVHFRRLTAPRGRDYYSLLLILAFLITAAAGFILGPTHPQFMNVVTNIQMPIEAALMGMLAISLAYACLRLYQRRKGWMTVVFIVSAVVFLLIGSSYLAIGNSIPVVHSIVDVLNQFQIAGARGILLGIALGSLLTGLRVLLGVDRPYSG